MKPAPVAVTAEEAAALDDRIERHVEVVLIEMRRRLDREPTLDDLEKWAREYQLVSDAMIARVKTGRARAAASAAVVETTPVELAAPVVAPVKARKAKHRGPAPQFPRSHHKAAPPTHPEPIQPAMAAPSVTKLTADEVLAKRPAKPPQRRRVTEEA